MVLTCGGERSAAAPTPCRLMHRDAHLALETLSDQVPTSSSSLSSSSVKERCFLVLTPVLSRKIIHSDRSCMTPVLAVSIFPPCCRQDFALGSKAKLKWTARGWGRSYSRGLYNTNPLLRYHRFSTEGI